MFDQALLDQIRSANDIAQVVGEYVPLKKAGTNSFKGLCPFHKEKTPSFHVNTALQIYKCFGCGAGGNVTTFMSRIENIAFPEAVKRLADRARIPLPQQDTPAAQERRRLLQICETAATIYHKSLVSGPEAARARQYLAKRGITPAAIENFRLGYSNGQQIFSLRVHPALLNRAGLSTRASDGSNLDRMRGRIVIPITDESGQVIGFGGRALDQAVQPKYLNSPETPLFKKSAALFGLSFAREPIRRSGRAILVEGYFDAIGAHMNGITSVIAALGTSLTEQQLRMLKRFTRKLVIVYDEDVGGNEAALRGLDLASSEGFDVKIARLPGGMDPDEFILKQGKENFLKALEDAAGGEAPSSPLQTQGVALSLFDFRLEIACRHADSATLEGRTMIVAALVPFLARLPNAIERHAYTKRLAERLDVREQDIAEELEKFKAGQGSRPLPKGQKQTPVQASRNAATWRAESLILAGVLEHKPAAIDALLELSLEAFPSRDARALAEHLKRLFSEGTPFSVASLIDQLQSSPGIVELLAETEAASNSAAEPGRKTDRPKAGADASFREAAAQLKRRHTKEQLKVVQHELERTKDPEAVARLLEAKQRLACANS